MNNELRISELEAEIAELEAEKFKPTQTGELINGIPAQYCYE